MYISINIDIYFFFDVYRIECYLHGAMMNNKVPEPNISRLRHTLATMLFCSCCTQQ